MRRKTKCAGRPRRPGYIIIWFAVSLVLLVGMAGLVIDGGMYMAKQRHAQSAGRSSARPLRCGVDPLGWRGR